MTGGAESRDGEMSSAEVKHRQHRKAHVHDNVMFVSLKKTQRVVIFTQKRLEKKDGERILKCVCFRCP